MPRMRLTIIKSHTGHKQASKLRTGACVGGEFREAVRQVWPPVL